MPTKGVYSHVIEPNRYINPLDLNIYMQGEQHKENIAKENLQLLSSAYGDLSNIPAYGIDAQELQKEMGNIKSQLSSVNLSNLTDPNSFSQINSIINNAKNNPKILAIAERGNNYKKMLEEKAEFEKKGKVYVNRGLTQLNKYYSGNTFNEKLRVGNDGYAAPEAGEIMEQVKKIVTPDEKRVLLPNGQYSIQKYYDPIKLNQAFDLVTSSDPNYEKFQRDTLEDALEGVDITEYAKQTYQPLLETNYNNYNTAVALYQKTGDKKYLQDAVTAKANIDEANSVLNNPYSAEAFKKQMLKKQKEADINAMTQALNFHQDGDIKMDQATEMSKKFQYDKGLIEYRAKFAAASGDLSDLDKLVYSAAINSGKGIYDENGNLIPAKNLASSVGVVYNPKESMDNKTSIKATPETKIQIGDQSFKVSDVEQNIKSGNKEMIKSIINQYIEPTEDGEDVEIDGDKIYYEKEGYFGSNSTGWDKEITVEELLKKVKGETQTESNSIPTAVNYQHKAKIGEELIYSNDGTNWYKKDGTKVD